MEEDADQLWFCKAVLKKKKTFQWTIKDKPKLFSV